MQYSRNTDLVDVLKLIEPYIDKVVMVPLQTIHAIYTFTHRNSRPMDTDKFAKFLINSDVKVQKDVTCILTKDRQRYGVLVPWHATDEVMININKEKGGHLTQSIIDAERKKGLN